MHAPSAFGGQLRLLCRLAGGMLELDQLWPCLHRGFKKQANEVRPGNVLDFKERLMQVVKYQHTQGAGRQLGNVQLELRDMKTGSKHQARFRTADSLEVVRLEQQPFQFLYAEGKELHFMSLTTFEQSSLSRKLFGRQADFLAEGMEVQLDLHDGEAVAGTLPQQVTLPVVEGQAIAFGDSMKGAQYREVTLQNGARVQAPHFVQAGDRITVRTADGAFIKRA